MAFDDRPIIWLFPTAVTAIVMALTLPVIHMLGWKGWPGIGFIVGMVVLAWFGIGLSLNAKELIDRWKTKRRR